MAQGGGKCSAAARARGPLAVGEYSIYTLKVKIFLGFLYILGFTVLCHPKGCLLRSNRLSLKVTLEKEPLKKAILERVALKLAL